MNDIEKYYKNALIDNLCADYKGRWRRAHGDRLSLLRLCLNQQAIPHVVSYAYQGRGITKEFVTTEYADLINGYTVTDADNIEGYTYGLFADYDYDNDLVADKDVCSIMWTVGATIVVPKTKAPTIYISNRSKVHLVCEGFNSVRIYLFDESEVTLEDVDADSSVTIYQYCDKAKVEIGRYCLSTNVRQFRKRLKL